jgi:uroporphyrinogen decarboxylase
MTSRDRVQRAIHFQGPDHIPHFLPDGEENDLLWLWTPRVPDPQPWTVEADGLERRIDAWGTTWVRPVGEHNHGEKCNLPIPDITRQAEYLLPDQNTPAFFAGACEAIAANNAAANPKYCLGVMPISSLNEGTHNLLGLDNMFVAYYEEPDALKALIARLAAAQRESIRALAAIGCNGVMGYDDWGLQDRLMVGLDLIEEFFRPHYEENWALAHSLGMDVWLHSCGYIVPLLPKLHAWGLDVIQQDQQENQGLEKLDAAVGGKLAFWCPVDVQKTMVDGTEDDIRAYVRRMRATIGNHRGGLISMAYSTPEAVGHDPRKTAAMCAAFREYGRYEERGGVTS